MSDAASLAPNPARLAEIIRARSFGMGKTIRLASGRESNFYFNMKPTMLDPEGSALIAAEVLARRSASSFASGLAASPAVGYKLRRDPAARASRRRSPTCSRP